MESFLNKKHKLDSTENFDEYMKALGVDAVRRLASIIWFPVFELTCDGDVWTMSNKFLFKSSQVKFKLGEEFDEERTDDGVPVKSVITIEGNKMTHTMKGEPESTVVLEFSDSEMIAVATVKEVTCKRTYKAQ